MEKQKLLFYLIIGFVWIYSGIILSFANNKSLLQTTPYQVAKKYMVIFLFYIGVSSIIASSSKFIFRDSYEVLYTFILFNDLVAIVLLLFCFVSLFDYKKINKFRIVRIFIFISVLIFFYCIVEIVFEESRNYSFIELIKSICSIPFVIIKLLIQSFIILGSVVVVLKYLKCNNIFLPGIHKRFDDDDEYNRVKWNERIFVVMICMGILCMFGFVLTWGLYIYLYKILATCGVIYYTISFINYQQIGWEVFPLSESDTFTRECKDEKKETIIPGLASELSNEDQLKYFDEVHYCAKKAVDKWVNNPEKPYLKAGITLKDAALGIGMSRRKLSDFIKSEYDSNFNMWINILRIKEVERILKEENTNLSLSYIADCTGFSDLAAMSKTFKKITGLSPSQFRKMLMKKLICEELAVEQEE